MMYCREDIKGGDGGGGDDDGDGDGDGDDGDGDGDDVMAIAIVRMIAKRVGKIGEKSYWAGSCIDSFPSGDPMMPI